MENLNAEQVKKALECCPNRSCGVDCPYYDAEICALEVMRDALALINSQEQRIKELTEVVERSETAQGCKESVDNGFSPSVTELQRENERLRSILLQFTDIVHKWGNKNGYDTSEISLVPIINEGSEIEKQIRAETLQKYKSAIIEYYSKPKYQPTKEHPIKHTQIEYLFTVLDQIAKEMCDEI